MGVTAAGILGALVCSAARAQDAAAQRITPAVRVFRECSPAVVNLSTTTIVTMQRRFGVESIFEDIFDLPAARPRSFKTNSVGSGFVIHEGGYIVTNAHVIDRASEIKVTFADGTELPAEEIARDRRHDLAVLKVDADRPLPFLRMGRSDDLMPGESVIAIGNPFGYQHTITTGIISALDRELRFSRDQVYSGLIQTDASINPGNSGGPLLNVLGELIGINTAIRGDAQNIGFAIPVDRLHDLLPAMLDIQRLRRVEFGIHFDSKEPRTNPPGIAIRSVDPGSPAHEAGVRAGDVVVGINDTATPRFMEAFSVLHHARPGNTLRLDLLRGGERSVRPVKMLAIPELDSAALMARRFGIHVRELNPADLRRRGLRRAIGLEVKSVEPGTQAAEAGLSAGDLITLFGGWPVTSLAALGPLIEQVNSGDLIPVHVLRIDGERLIRAELALQAK